MSTIANAMSAAGAWLFILVTMVALMSVAYGLYSDQGSGITTRERERLSPREQFEMWKRGTR
jgi:hypothetical protein